MMKCISFVAAGLMAAAGFAFEKIPSAHTGEAIQAAIDAVHNAAEECDIAIYGATPAGIAAAVQARRMGLEPVVIELVFFALGQSAATAASLAVADGCAVQDVDYGKLRERLLKDLQRLAIK